VNAFGINRCAYCRTRWAVTVDHVVPRSLIGKHRSSRRRKKPCTCRRHDVPAFLLVTVLACLECNLLKGTRRLIPLSWEPCLPELERYFPGTPWRVWSGDVREPAFREVWV